MEVNPGTVGDAQTRARRDLEHRTDVGAETPYRIALDIQIITRAIREALLECNMGAGEIHTKAEDNMSLTLMANDGLMLICSISAK